MARKNRTYQVNTAADHKAVEQRSTSDGGTITIYANRVNGDQEIKIVRGYRETPEERRERLAHAGVSRKFTPGNKRQRGGRSGAKKAAIRDSY